MYDYFMTATRGFGIIFAPPEIHSLPQRSVLDGIFDRALNFLIPSMNESLLSNLRHKIVSSDGLTKEDIDQIVSNFFRLSFFHNIPIGSKIDPETYELALPFFENVTDMHAKLELLSVIKEMDLDDREEICKYARRFLSHQADGFARAKILKTIAMLPILERAEICVCAEFFMNGISAEHLKNQMIKLIGGIEPAKRKTLSEASEEIKNWDAKLACKLRSIHLFIAHSEIDNFSFFIFIAQNACLSNQPVNLYQFWKNIPKLEEKGLLQIFKCVKNSFQLKAILQTIMRIPQEERLELYGDFYSIIEGLDYLGVIEMIQFLHSFAQSERTSLCLAAKEMIYPEAGHERRKELMKALDPIPLKSRLRVCQLIKEFFARDIRKAVSLIKLVQHVPLDQLEAIVKDGKSLKHHYINPPNFIFVFFMCFPPKNYEFLQNVLKANIGQIASKNYVLSIKSVIERYPESREETYLHLIQLLESQNDHPDLLGLANSIWNHLYEFEMDDFSPLAQAALNRIIAMKKEGNCYSVHKHLQSFQKEILPPFSLPKVSKYGVDVTLDLNGLQKESNFQIHADQLPKVSLQTVLMLFNQLEARLNKLPHARRNETENAIKEMTENVSWHEIKNKLIDQYLVDICNRDFGDKVPVYQALFFAIVHFINCQTNELQKNELISPREEILLKIACSIADCKTGKMDGISLAYNALPQEFKYASLEKVDTSNIAKAKQHLKHFLQFTLMNILSDDNALMRECLGIDSSLPKISQLPHQSLYLKNAIGSRIGLIHTVTFDSNGEFVYKALIKRSLSDLLTIFYKHFTVSYLVQSLMNYFKGQSLVGIYEPFNELAASSGMEIWQTSEEDDDLVLTEKGALLVLMGGGYLKRA